MRTYLPAKRRTASRSVAPTYNRMLSGMIGLLESARRVAARSVNSVMTATYWEMGRRIVEFEQAGQERATYGVQLLEKLALDLTRRFGKGFSRQNIQSMRLFYLAYPPEAIRQTLSGKSSHIFQTPSERSVTSVQTSRGLNIRFIPRFSSIPIRQTVSGKSKIRQTPSAESELMPIRLLQTNKSLTFDQLAQAFPLPWSHYVALLSVDDVAARKFYETEALRGGWSVRQLERQIATLFYQRALASRNKLAMIVKGARPQPEDVVTADEEVRDDLVLEFLNLKNEYSENDLEDALVKQLEEFLLELGNEFSFIARQRRTRIGRKWYRMDLVLYNRLLRCLVLIDLKLGELTHADTGQMRTYLNYAREHWTHEHENPPVGLILTSKHDRALARYAFDTVHDRILVREYKLRLPNEKLLVAELLRVQAILSKRFPPPTRKRKR